MTYHSCLYDMNYALDLQESYKTDKPKKFAGGKWSPRARQMYDLFSTEEQTIFDSAWLIKDAHPYSGGELDDFLRESFSLPEWEKEYWSEGERLHQKYGWCRPTEGEMKQKMESRYSDPVERDEIEAVEDLKCPKCGYGLLEKDGKYGKFYGCSQFPGCWGTLPHPDNPDTGERAKKEKFYVEGQRVNSYVSYHTKFNGKKVKDRTPTEHSVYLEDESLPAFTIKTHGGNQHLYKGDTCSFTYTVDWRGDAVIHKNTLKAWKKNGAEVKRR